jgi:hypothetical protein
VKKRFIFRYRRPILLISILLFLGGYAASDPLADEGAEWLNAVEEAAAQELSINVEDVNFAFDSFFDVFVEVVLREGLPSDMEDPILGTALTSEEVSEIIRRQGPELFQVLPRLVLPDGQVVPTAPGAAVYKWDPEGRWSRGPHRFAIYNWVMVNQWIRASMNTTKLVWKVFKPGVYSTDCMYLNVHSNGNMLLTLDNLGPLADAAGNTIETAYGFSSYIYTDPDLVLPGQSMGGADMLMEWVPDGGFGRLPVGPHQLVKVWNSISVGSGAAPGLFTTDGPSAVITVIPEI